MEQAASPEESSIESELAETIKYIDLYIRQKTDLFLQQYVFEPFDFLIRQVMYLSVLVTLLAAGTLALVIGVILFMSTIIPLWTALLIVGAIVFLIAGVIAYVLFSNKIVLKTPTTMELVKDGKR